MSDISKESASAVDIEEAAMRLGIDVDTVQRALQRALLAGFQASDGHWKVFLDLQRTPDPAPAAPTESLGESLAEPLADSLNDSGPAAALPPLAAPRPSDQADDLRALLRRREQELVEKDRLIAELARSLARLGEAAVERLQAVEAQTPAAAHDPRFEEAIDNIRQTLHSVRSYLVQQKRQFPDGE